MNNLDELWNVVSAKEELLRTRPIHRMDVIVPLNVIRKTTTTAKSVNRDTVSQNLFKKVLYEGNNGTDFLKSSDESVK